MNIENDICTTCLLEIQATNAVYFYILVNVAFDIFVIIIFEITLTLIYNHRQCPKFVYIFHMSIRYSQIKGCSMMADTDIIVRVA